MNPGRRESSAHQASRHCGLFSGLAHWTTETDQNNETVKLLWTLLCEQLLYCIVGKNRKCLTSELFAVWTMLSASGAHSIQWYDCLALWVTAAEQYTPHNTRRVWHSPVNAAACRLCTWRRKPSQTRHMYLSIVFKKVHQAVCLECFL